MLSAISTARTSSIPAARRRVTAPDKAGRLEAPEMTATPAARAAASSVPIRADEVARVGEIEIVDAGRDAGFGNVQARLLKRPRRVDDDRWPMLGEREIAASVERDRNQAVLPGAEIPCLGQAAAGDDHLVARVAQPARRRPPNAP